MADRSQRADLAEIRRAVGLLFEPQTVAELRVLDGPDGGTYSGYFNNRDELVRVAASFSGRAPAVYTTLNPVDPALLDRRRNRVKKLGRKESATSDSEIVRRRWLPFDCDPKRPSGISSTDAQHEAALARARQVRDWLRDVMGFAPASLILADSGNGAHVLARIDLPNDADSLALVNRCIEAVALQFEDSAVVIDRTLGNAARVWKLYGSMACKGDASAVRPHRIARLLEVPA